LPMVLIGKRKEQGKKRTGRGVGTKKKTPSGRKSKKGRRPSMAKKSNTGENGPSENFG